MGGRSSSSSAQSTQTNNYDQRRVIGEGAIALEASGFGRATYAPDYSSETNLAYTSDSSNRSTNTTTITAIDGGAIASAAQQVMRALGVVDGAVAANAGLIDSFGARLGGITTDATRAILDAAGQGIDASQATTARAFDVVDAAVGSARSATAAAQQSFGQAATLLQGAYADAKGTSASLQTMVMVALGVAGAVAVFALMRR
jgi:hypothetical protein